MARASFLAAALLTAITPAAAEEPAAPAPAECGIRLRRAPDDVRAAIEGTLLTDPSACRGSLDVWIVPAEGGLYVQSRDHYGRVRERVVADAATAATLLMSWVEIDTAEPVWSPPAEAAPVVEVEPEDAPAPRVATVAAPGMVETEPTVTAEPEARRPFLRPRSIGFAGTMQQLASGLSGIGYRADVELGPWHGFAISLEAGEMSLTGATEAIRDPIDPSSMTYESGRGAIELVVNASKRLGDGRVQFVPGIGLGASFTRHDTVSWIGTQSPLLVSSRSIGPRAETSLVLSVRVASDLRFETGLRASMVAYKQTDGSAMLPVWADSGTTLHLGLRWRP